jgi:hypothetical protein
LNKILLQSELVILVEKTVAVGFTGMQVATMQLLSSTMASIARHHIRQSTQDWIGTLGS